MKEGEGLPKKGERLHPLDPQAQAKMQEGIDLVEKFKEQFPLGSFQIISEDFRQKPVLGAEISPKRTIRRFVEINIKLRSFL